MDALLHGNLSADQVANLRTEIASRAEEEAARLARSYPPPSPPSQRAAPPSSPHASAPPAVSPVAFGAFGALGQAYPPTSPAPSSRPGPAGGNLPSWPVGAPRTRPPPDAGEEEGQRTVVRTYVPAAALPDEDEQRTMARAYVPPAARVPAHLLDDDDQRTRARASYAPPILESSPPISFEPPADIAEPYVFDDDPPVDERLDDDGGGRTVVHVYTPNELREVDLGDLGDLDGPMTSPGRGAPTSAPRTSPEYDALLDQTFLVALGGPAGVPSLALPPARVTELPLGPQTAFLLSRIDGLSSIDDVLDMSVLPRLETLRLLYDLLQQGVIRVEGSADVTPRGAQRGGSAGSG